MQDINELLGIRKSKKRKKPFFVRKDIYKKKKLSKAWRKARGLDNKQRIHKRGAPQIPSTGYRAPRAVRGLHPSGLQPMQVSNLNQLAKATKADAIILSSTLGNKKRLMLLNEIKKRGLVLVNLDADKTIEKINSKLKQRTALRLKRMEEQKSKKKSLEEKAKKEEPQKKDDAKKEETGKQEAKEPAKEEPQLSDDEKKKIEKEEKDKLLIKRG